MPQDTKGTVLDRASTYALLKVAKAERYLEEDPSQTDRFMDSGFYGNTVVDGIGSQVLEQLVLTPKLYTFAHLPERGLGGALFEEGLVERIPPPEEPGVVLDQFPVGVISGMLRAQGNLIPENEYEPRLRAVFAAMEEAEAYERAHGRPTPNLVAKQIADIIAGPNHPDEYTDQEYEDERRRQKAYSGASSILGCVREYVDLLTAAESRDAYHKVAIDPALDTRVAIGSSEEPRPEADELVLLRITANGLGKLSSRSTLRGTLELAREPATQALREHLPLWLKELASAEVSEVEYIQNEIRDATKALQKLHTVQTVGTITTWIAVPVSMVEFMLSLPPSLGIVASLVGKGASWIDARTIKKYRWAMFGNTG